MEQKKEITLKYSILVPKDGEMVETTLLRMGRMKLKHLNLLPDDFMEKGGKVSPGILIPLVAGIADIPIESAGEIDLDDFDVIADGIMAFLAESPLTGKK